MPDAIWFISYKLKKDVSVEDFLLASEKCHNEVLSSVSFRLFNPELSQRLDNSGFFTLFV